MLAVPAGASKGGFSVIRLKIERERRGLSRAALARAAGLGQGLYGWIESRRFVPYPPQLERIAQAVGFDGDPQGLLEEVGEAEPA